MEKEKDLCLKPLMKWLSEDDENILDKNLELLDKGIQMNRYKFNREELY